MTLRYKDIVFGELGPGFNVSELVAVDNVGRAVFTLSDRILKGIDDDERVGDRILVKKIQVRLQTHLKNKGSENSLTNGYDFHGFNESIIRFLLYSDKHRQSKGWIFPDPNFPQWSIPQDLGGKYTDNGGVPDWYWSNSVGMFETPGIISFYNTSNMSQYKIYHDEIIYKKPTTKMWKQSTPVAFNTNPNIYDNEFATSFLNPPLSRISLGTNIVLKTGSDNDFEKLTIATGTMAGTMDGPIEAPMGGGNVGPLAISLIPTNWNLDNIVSAVVPQDATQLLTLNGTRESLTRQEFFQVGSNVELHTWDIDFPGGLELNYSSTSDQTVMNSLRCGFLWFSRAWDINFEMIVRIAYTDE